MADGNILNWKIVYYIYHVSETMHWYECYCVLKLL